MILNDVHRGINKNRKPKRVGRGTGSGHGKTAGRGHKGQGSRSGASRPVVFQGGTMPLVRRVPKRGFHHRGAPQVTVVNVGDLEQAFESGAEVTVDAMSAKNLARGRFDLLKVLAGGDLTKKLKVHAHRFSAAAQEKIEKAGGQVIVLPGKTPVEVKKRQARSKGS